MKDTKQEYGYTLGELTAVVERMLPQFENTESLRGEGNFCAVVADTPSKIDFWLVEIARLETEDLAEGISKSDFMETLTKYYDLRDKVDLKTYSTKSDQGYWFGYYQQKARGSVQLTRQRIGARVKELREEKGLTQRQLADMSGIGYPHLCRIEKGQYNVSVDILSRLSTALGTELTLA